MVKKAATQNLRYLIVLTEKQRLTSVLYNTSRNLEKGKKVSHEEASKGEGKAHPKSDLTHEMEG
ncbi:hypothetical protein V1477_020855 [Vespula maculifrons]|uniref:Uncharacterized protein n=1 Tax=Vespula maculifrons TaxID=7453 RepID=A0ABD2AQ70_VESMC